MLRGIRFSFGLSPVSRTGKYVLFWDSWSLRYVTQAGSVKSCWVAPSKGDCHLVGGLLKLPLISMSGLLVPVIDAGELCHQGLCRAKVKGPRKLHASADGCQKTYGGNVLTMALKTIA